MGFRVSVRSLSDDFRAHSKVKSLSLKSMFSQESLLLSSMISSASLNVVSKLLIFSSRSWAGFVICLIEGFKGLSSFEDSFESFTDYLLLDLVVTGNMTFDLVFMDSWVL